MSNTNAAAAASVSFALGVLAHLTVFRYGEWDMRASAICGSWLGAYVILALFLVRNDGGLDLASLYIALLSARNIILAHLLGLSASIIAYRLFFHRLNKFPGPIGAKITGWYHSFLYIRKMQLHEEIRQLHHRYGPIVRTAPSSLSIADPDAIALLYAGNSSCVKGTFYNMTLPRTPINFERAKVNHARRRKEWEHAFNAKALKSYEPMISVHVAKLLAILKENGSQPMNIAKQIKLTIFELSVQLAFDKQFTPKDEANKQFFIRIIRDAASLLGLFATVPWAIHLIKLIPGLNRSSERFVSYANELISERRAKPPPELPDIFSWMLEKYESAPVKTAEMDHQLNADAITVTLASTGTTASALTAALYWICQSADVIVKLQKELDDMGYYAASPDHAQLAQAKYLNACITETLRMSPPIPTVGYYRDTPPEGLQLGDIHIPGNVTVVVPQYTMNHDPRFWHLPDDFIPERWLDRPDLIKNPAVFIPFQIGPYACVGKFLALSETRVFLASILSAFSPSPAPGQTKDKFLKLQKNTMEMTYGDVGIVFGERGRVG